MGKYLDLARQAIADLKDGPMILPESPETPHSVNALEYEINESNEKRVSPSRSADPTNSAVRAARAEAEWLGVLDVTFPPSPASAEVRCRWLEGDALNQLPEQLQGLTVQRENWTPTRWAEYLRHRARICNDQHRDVAKMYERAATLLCRGNEGNTD